MHICVCRYTQESLSYSLWLSVTPSEIFPEGIAFSSHHLFSELEVFVGPVQSPFWFRCVSPLTRMGWDEMFNTNVKTLPSALLGSFPCISIGESIYHGKRGNYLKGLYCRAVALWKPWQSNWIWLVCKAAREINKRRGRKWGGGAFHVFAVKYPFIWLPVTNFSSSLMWSVVEDFSGL